MQCPQCQHENPAGAKFCNQCATPLAPQCSACGSENASDAKFCNQCATALTGTASAPSPSQPIRPQPDAESRFHALLPAVIGWLQRDKRVTYRELKHVFGVDNVLLDEIRKALAFKHLAIDEDGEGLVWTGEAQPAVQPAVAPTRPPALPEAVVVTSPTPPELASSITATDTPHDEPIVSPEALPTDTPPEEVVAVSEPAHIVPEAERRQLTVMFCDLADSTKLSQQLDPEDLREVVRAYQTTAAEVTEQYEGHIAQYLGDGLLIYFGWPVAHEDDAQRSLHAGLGIVEAISTILNPRLQREKGVQLTVRLGVHTGPVVVGEMGGGGRHESLATGETVNIASRLEGLAAPNTVVISSVTERLVRGAFALEDFGQHILKGVAEPMQVFRVLGPVEMNDDAPRAAGIPFLVGRDEEIGLLLRRWEQSKEGLGQVVQLCGEAGIGKSSLVEMLRTHVRHEGLPRIAYNCSPYHQNSALYPVIAHLEHVLRFEREDPPVGKLNKLIQGLQTYSLPLEDVVPLFAALLSIPLDDRYPMPTLTSQQQKQQTVDALVAWLVEVAEQQPILVVWENLHWADPSSLEMLELVLEQTPTVPMLSVLTFRPEFSPSWPMRSHMTPITLNRLERPQVEALITHMARGKALPEEIVQHIVVKTDGVPLYVEELTKMLLASELICEEADRYVLTGPLLTVAIPDTLQDSLMARLDQMNTAKELAQLGAVLGREFPYELIQMASSQDDATVQAGLAQLVEAELLYQRGRPPRARYIFKHALLQDAAYQSLLRRTRQQYHQRVAELMEAQFPALVKIEPEVVAHHYTEAGCPEQAVQYWHQAGERARQGSAHVEAIAHLNKALELLITLTETAERNQQELVLRLALGPSLIAVRGYASLEVEQLYSRARALCRQMGETTQVFPMLWGLWGFYVVSGNHQGAREVGEELLRLAQREQDPIYLAEAHLTLGGALFCLAEFVPASELMEQGADLYDPQHHQAHTDLFAADMGVFCRAWAPHPLWHLGYPDRALARSRQALALAEELAHPFTLAVALDYAAIFHQFRREAHIAYQRAEAAIAICAEQKFAYYLGWAMIIKGWALAEQGDIETGITQIHRGLDTLRDTGAKRSLPYYLALLAEVYGESGQAEEGLRVLDEAFAEAQNIGEPWWEAGLHRLRGELILRSEGRIGKAALTPEACFRKALDVARSQQSKSLELRAATSLARLWQSRGKRQEAYDLLAPVYGWFTEGFDTVDLMEAKELLVALR